jgi:hypothetical protein
VKKITLQASRKELKELLRFMRLPAAVRKERVLASVGEKVPPPWLDDRVCNVAHGMGLTAYFDEKAGEGDMIAQPAPGESPVHGTWVVRVTDAGLKFLYDPLVPQ